MILVDRADADFVVAGFQGSELKAAFELMGHRDLVAIDEQMDVIHLCGRLCTSYSSLSVCFAVEFRAVGGREDRRIAVFRRRGQDEERGSGMGEMAAAMSAPAQAMEALYDMINP